MITIVGGLPEPVGGVTTFIMRLAFALGVCSRTEVEILDLYPKKKKVAAPPRVRHLVGPSFRPLKYLWLARNVRGKETVHFNFSTPRSLPLLLLMPKGNSRWILTLHHGNLAAYDSALTRLLWPLLIRRLDQIVGLSQLQCRYYIGHDVPADKLLLGGSYVKPSSPTDDPTDDIFATIEQLRSLYRTIVFASGYPTNAYRHRELIDTFARVAKDRSVCLILCLYGPDREGILDTIRTEARAASPHIYLTGQLDEGSFNYLLKNSDIYVRANSVDSCGIAMVDAISYGVRVIASDVCKRPKAATLFRTGNYSDLEAKLIRSLEGRPSQATPVADVDDALGFYDELYRERPRLSA